MKLTFTVVGLGLLMTADLVAGCNTLYSALVSGPTSLGIVDGLVATLCFGVASIMVDFIRQAGKETMNDVYKRVDKR